MEVKVKVSLITEALSRDLDLEQLQLFLRELNEARNVVSKLIEERQSQGAEVLNFPVANERD